MLGLDPKNQQDFIVGPLRAFQQLLEAWSAHGRRAVREPMVRDTGLDGRGLPPTFLAAALLAEAADGLAAPLERVLVLPANVRPAGAGDVAALLRRALDRLEAGALGPALSAVEDAWRACRVPALADVLGALDAKLPDEPVPVPKRKGELEEVWLSKVGVVRPERLFTAPWPTQWRDAQRRMNALYGLPPSPRLAEAAQRLAQLEPLPYTAQAAQPFWQGLAWFIAEQGDVRQLDALLAFETRLARFVRRAETPATDALRAVRTVELDAATLALVSALERAVGPAPTRSAVAPVKIPPQEARRVWADELSEAGDPRGELVALQLALADGTASPSATARVRTLLNKHARAWAPVGLARETVVFRAGVPVEGQLAHRSDRELTSFIGAPWLASLERILLDGAFALGRVRARTEAEFVAAAAQGALRCAAVRAETANELCDCPTSALSHLQLVDDEPIEFDGDGLASLRRLDVQRPRLTSWPKRPWFRRLNVLGLPSLQTLVDLRSEASLPPTLACWSFEAHHLRKQTSAHQTWELLLHREGGLWLELVPLPGARVEGGLALLEALPPFEGLSRARVPKALNGPVLDGWRRARRVELELVSTPPEAAGTSVELLRGGAV